VSAPVVEQAPRPSDDLPVGHYSFAPDERLALCGEPILGIRAFGEHIVCPDCARLYALLAESWVN
jgi:hypothetical protein